MLVNPQLKWDGETSTRQGKPIEKPRNWMVTVLGDPVAIFHIDEDGVQAGLKLDFAYAAGSVTLSQRVTLPAGTHYLVVQCFSHVVIQGDYDAGWRVSFTPDNGDSLDMSDGEYVWVGREKSDQSFAVRINLEHEASGVIALTYRTRYASTTGEMQLRYVDVRSDARLPGWGDDLPVKATLGERSVPEVPEAPDKPKQTAFQMRDYLLPAGGNVHKLTSGEFIFSEMLSANSVLIRKNRHQEHIVMRDGYLWRGFDDSAMWSGQVASYIPATGKAWEEGGTYGHRWLPEVMSVGETFSSVAFVTYYARQSGDVLRKAQMENHYKLVAHHDEYKGVQDVIEVEWRLGDATKPTADETYFLARNRGYIEWRSSNGSVRNTFDRLASLAEVRSLNINDRYTYSWFDPASIEVEQGGGEVPSLYDPKLEWEQVMLLGGAVNIREAPGGAFRRTAQPGEEFARAKLDDVWHALNGRLYRWHGVRWEDDAGVIRYGWIADVNGSTLAPVPAVPEGDLAKRVQELETKVAQMSVMLENVSQLATTLDGRLDALDVGYVWSDEQMRVVAQQATTIAGALQAVADVFNSAIPESDDDAA